MAKRKLIFRGAQFRHVAMPMVEGQAIVRIDVSCDITPALAEEFGWEIYQPVLSTDGKKQPSHLSGGLKGSTKLEGEIYIESLMFEVNGASANGLECAATTVQDFSLTRKKSETGDGIETRLHFQIVSTAWRLVSEFWGMMGGADGRLTVYKQPEQGKLQPTLDEAAEDGEETPAETAEEEPENAEPQKRGKKFAFGTIADRNKARMSGLKVDVGGKKPS